MRLGRSSLLEHVLPRRIGEGWELIAAESTGADHFAAVGRKPCCAMAPPGSLMFLGMTEPFVGAVGITIRRPVGVLILGRRIDDARNVARSAEHKLHWAGEDSGDGISRFPGGDVILNGREEVARGPDPCEVDGPTGEVQSSRLNEAVLHVDVDRGYFNSPEILECHEAGVTVTLPKPMTSGAKAAGRFGKQDFVYLPDEDVYRCPAGERLKYRYSNEEDGKELRRYWTTACPICPLKPKCTTGSERRIPRWEHEHLLEAVQQRLDANPNAMRLRRETVQHPFGTIKARMGATHFLMKTLPKVAAEMAAFFGDRRIVVEVNEIMHHTRMLRLAF
jgi:Transposase DDE domain